MGDVVSIKPDEPHKSGEFKCLVCDHEYIGIAPILDEDGNPLLWYECPQCGCERSTHKHHKVNLIIFTAVAVVVAYLK